MSKMGGRKKFNCLAVMLACALGIVACGGETQSAVAESNSESVIDGQGANTTSSTDTNVNVEEEISSAPVIDTEYYQIQLPETWIDKYVCTIYENNVTLYEKADYDLDESGFLADIELLPVGTEPEYFYEEHCWYDKQYLGIIDNGEDKFHLLVRFSHEYGECSEENYDQYVEMITGIESGILRHVTPKKGIVFTEKNETDIINNNNIAETESNADPIEIGSKVLYASALQEYTIEESRELLNGYVQEILDEQNIDIKFKLAWAEKATTGTNCYYFQIEGYEAILVLMPKVIMADDQEYVYLLNLYLYTGSNNVKEIYNQILGN